MKKILALILCAGFVCMAAACGNSEDKVNNTEADSAETSTEAAGFEYDLDNYKFYEIDDFSEYLSLGQYEGVTVKVSATDEEIESRVQDILEKYAEKTEIKDRTVETGDLVTIDYTGYMDGETFEGGSATDRSLVVGANTFIKEFEDGLVGAALNSEFEINLTFPEDYPHSDYAGKPARFEVKLKKIEARVVPELTDEFANKYNSDYQTVEEFKAGLGELIKEEKMEKEALTSNAWNVVINNCEIKDVPEDMIKYYYDSLYASYAYYVYYNYNYKTIEEYLDNCDDITMEDLTSRFMTQAQGYAVSELVYRAICADKGYALTDELYNEYKENYKKENNTEPTDIEIRQALYWDYASKCVIDSVVCE